MKLTFFLLLVSALGFVSCAQSPSKPEAKTPEQTQTGITQTVKMSIEGMVCNACRSSVKKSIKSVDGVKEVEVNLENRNAVVTFYPALVKPEVIQAAVNKGGFAAGKPQPVKQ